MNGLGGGQVSHVLIEGGLFESGFCLVERFADAGEVLKVGMGHDGRLPEIGPRRQERGKREIRISLIVEPLVIAWIDELDPALRGGILRVIIEIAHREGKGTTDQVDDLDALFGPALVPSIEQQFGQDAGIAEKIGGGLRDNRPGEEMDGGALGDLVVMAGGESVLAVVALRTGGEAGGDKVAEGAGEVVARFVVVDDEVDVVVGVVD